MTPTPPPDWNAILGQIIATALPYVLALIGLAFTGLSLLGGIALNRLRARLAASEALDKDALDKSRAQSAVYLVEEEASRVKNATGQKLSSEKRLELAVMAIQDKDPGKPEAEAIADIHSSLGSIKGLGASKEVGAVGIAKVAVMVVCCLALSGCFGNAEMVSAMRDNTGTFCAKVLTPWGSAIYFQSNPAFGAASCDGMTVNYGNPNAR